MECGFITVTHLAGRLVGIRSRGALTLGATSALLHDLREACEKITGKALVVGDGRQTRVAGDDILPLFLDAARTVAPSIERAGFLVDHWRQSGFGAASTVRIVHGGEQTFHLVEDLLLFMSEAADDAEVEALLAFFGEWDLGGIQQPARVNMGGSILLVEDNPDDVALTLGAFRKSRLANKVIVARDGVEALEWIFGTGARAGQPPLTPQVVLLDLQLPRVDGLDVLRRIRSNERTKLQPVVILTSSTDQRDLIEGYKLGINSYVRKPVDFSEFTDAVGQLGLYWLLTNRPPAPAGPSFGEDESSRESHAPA